MALMNYFQYFCIIIFLFVSKIMIISGASYDPQQLSDDMSMSKRHESWMGQHGRVYTDAQEKMKRLAIFKDNVQKIEAFNAGPDKGYKLGVNAFADMTIEELRSSLTGYKRKKTKNSSNFRYANVTDVPKTMDWRKKGAVTPVKDQRECFSCWAFSAVAAVEGVNQIKTGDLVSLSEQELMDCCRQPGEPGCFRGGEMNDAFKFIMNKKGLAKESDYPYTGSDETCKDNYKAAIKITGYEEVPANNETALLVAVAHQPVSVGVNSKFHFYSSGVFSGECGTYLDHGVTVVGYGETRDGIKYWLVKNSWGEGWGDKGYIKIKRGVAEKEGLCGIAMEGSYPTLDNIM